MKLKFLLCSFLFLLGNSGYSSGIQDGQKPNNFTPVNKVTFIFFGTRTTDDQGVYFRFFMSPSVYNYFSLVSRIVDSSLFYQRLTIDKSKIYIPEVRTEWRKVIDDFQSRVVPAVNSTYPHDYIASHLELDFSKSAFYSEFSALFTGKIQHSWRWEIPHLAEVLRTEGTMISILIMKKTIMSNFIA